VRNWLPFLNKNSADSCIIVIWRWWKISVRSVDRLSRPGELRESHEDFLDDTMALCQYDYLDHLSDSLLLFRQLCGSEEFWEQAVRRSCKTVSAEVASLALEVGWRSIFFSSKLHLQNLCQIRSGRTKYHQVEALAKKSAQEHW
uniref:Uncharacterized protein n=1 Tax=Mastacembelus armatus TaxID=205130 RepID=A0A3Q3KWX0_9TELE